MKNRTSFLKNTESKPLLIPSNQKYQVINKACRVVDEMQNSNVVIKHCMANTQSLGLSNREMITLSRLFIIARNLGYGWTSISTPDERMVSISSYSRSGDAYQNLISIDYNFVADSYLRIPPHFKNILDPRAIDGRNQPAIGGVDQIVHYLTLKFKTKCQRPITDRLTWNQGNETVLSRLTTMTQSAVRPCV